MIAIVMIGLLFLVGLGLGLYFFVFAKKECKKITDEDECTEPCRWDTYGDKCIGEKDTLTAAPTPTPPACSTYTTQDTCLPPCTWNATTGACSTSSGNGVVVSEEFDQVEGYPASVNGRMSDPVGGDWWLVAAGEALDPQDCKKAAIDAGSNNWGWRKDDKSCWSYQDSTLLTYYDPATAVGKLNHLLGCTKAGVKVKDGCRPSYKDLNILKGYPVTNMPSGHQELGETGEKYTMEECSKMAKEIGKTNWGYRTFMHATIPNTCWTYNDSMDIKGFKGIPGNTTEVMGCVDPTKKLKNGCAS